MSIRIGDKVRFLNEAGEGIVTSFKDKNTALVEISDGFEIPYAIKYLVQVQTELILKKESEDIEEEFGHNRKDAVFFVLEPDHELDILMSEYSFYLFNASNFNVLYTYSTKDGNNFQTLKQGELGSYQKLLLKKIRKQHLTEYAYHKIEMLFFKKSHYVAQLPVAEVIHINETILRRNGFVPNDSFKFPVYAITLKDNFFENNITKQTLTDYDLEKLRSLREFEASGKTFVKSKPKAPVYEREIDLHIEELIDSHKGMTNAEIIQLQLRKFQKELEAAISNNLQKIIFIHGVGNGRLKQEIHLILQGYDEVTFQDGSYKKYGYGATEVLIKHNR